jgi:HEAT repeat protein
MECRSSWTVTSRRGFWAWHPAPVAPSGPLPQGMAYVLALAACLLLCGCQNAKLAITATVAAPELRQRATQLLLRAAQSDDVELSCNAIEALVQVAPQQGLPYFRAALRSEYPLVRFAALTALGTLRDAVSRSEICSHLNDSSQLVRLAAAFAAYRCGEQQNAQVLLAALCDHPDENVRAEAAHLIGLLGERRAVGRLRVAEKLPNNERSKRVLIQIYTSMARLGDQQALYKLIDYYSQGDAASRILTLQGLAQLGSPESREALELRLSPDEDYLINRLIAARGLAKLGSKAGYDLALSSAGYSAQNPDDPEEGIRIRANAALALGAMGDPRALATLRKLAENGDDPRVQVAACFAICEIVKS